MKIFLRILCYLMMCSVLFTLSACSQDDLKNSSDLEEGVGNIINGGYLKESGNIYYYANSDDQNKLYQMNKNSEKKTKLSDQVNSSVNIKIQMDKDHLFYLQNTLVNNNLKCTLYCYDLIKNLEIKLSNQNICSYVIHNNLIYFTTLDTLELFQMNLDGTNEQQLEQFDNIAFIQTHDNKLYVDFNEALCEIKLDGSSMTSKYINIHSNLTTYQSNAYFVGGQKNLCRVSLDMKQQESEIVTVSDFPIESFNIYKDSIYISTTEQKIYRTDLVGGSMEYVANGMNPILVENILFFIDLNGKLTSVPI